VAQAAETAEWAAEGIEKIDLAAIAREAVS
jgi:hypothetical protein